MGRSGYNEERDPQVVPPLLNKRCWRHRYEDALFCRDCRRHAFRQIVADAVAHLEGDLKRIFAKP